MKVNTPESNLNIYTANILDWYDFGIFIFMSPLIVHLMLGSNKITSIMYGMVVFSIGYVFRPLGAVIFTSQRISYNNIFIITLLMSISTFR